MSFLPDKNLLTVSFKFSIIIPTLNEAAVINACLTALQPLRTQAELIVVDGDSIDNTRQLAEPLVDQVITTESGRSTQMNAGAQQASGDILVFLHADTSLPEQGLLAIQSALQSHRQWGRFDVRLSGQHFMLHIIAWLMNVRSRLTGIATGDQVIFVRKQIFKNIGGFPDIVLMEDISLCKQLKTLSKPACLRAKAISSGRRWEQFGIYKTILLMWSLRLRFFLGQSPEQLVDLYKRGLFWKQ